MIRARTFPLLRPLGSRGGRSRCRSMLRGRRSARHVARRFSVSAGKPLTLSTTLAASTHQIPPRIGLATALLIDCHHVVYAARPHFRPFTATRPDAEASDKSDVPSATCCPRRPSAFAALSRATAKYTAAILRRAGAAPVHPDWPARAAVCETCPLRVQVGNVSYCGQPAHRQPLRDPTTEGCGCPTREKARSPQEHCPFTQAMRPAQPSAGAPCNCKWCATTSANRHPHVR